MAAIGSVWGTGTWSDDIWALGTWGDAEEPAPAPPPAPGGGGAGGGSTQNRRVDFDLKGKPRRFDEEPKRSVIDVAARKAADAVVAKAQEIAREKAALNALKEAQQREKVSAARLAKTAAMEAKVAEMEAHLSILQDDEEVLQLFMKVLKH
jgi:hypothetical protein